MYPHERSLVKKFADAPFALIGVNSDKTLERARQAVQKHELSWRSFWNGPDGARGPISTAWNVRGWPTVVLIDHRGVIRHRGNSVDDSLLAQLVEEARAAGRVRKN